MRFEDFFRCASNLESGPLPYQQRLADGEAWPSRIEVPTGLGKTLAVITSWLWRRREDSAHRSATPRRLIYCLPMRVLVEQTERVARDAVARCGSKARVVVLMGGVEDSGGWDVAPEEDVILIGTQDMLLSRALNRGYGMSRFRWPMHFGLLNNDALWIIDEVQLVGRGVATSAQLQAFRRKLGTLGPTRTSWMSATLDDSWLKTVDVEELDLLGRLTLEASDLENPTVAQRVGAKKTLRQARAELGDLKGLAKEILSEHRAGTRTLAIVNTVDRAQELFAALRKEKPQARLLLLHSRFRPPDRARALAEALESPPAEGTLLLSTQVIEAGVDLSSTTLFTEVAPWASLVQRFGRCNRAGEQSDARIFWVAPGEKPAKDVWLPYAEDEVRAAEGVLLELADAGPRALPKRSMKLDEGLVLRRKDLLDLFDTTQDLSQGDLDISRFIREADDTDVRLCWRQSAPGEPGTPQRDELCTAPVRLVREWVEKKRRRAWAWDALRAQWSPVDRVYAGQTLVLESAGGGYDPHLGLQRRATGVVPPIQVTQSGALAADEDYEADPLSELQDWYTLARHSEDVEREAGTLCSALTLESQLAAAVASAARWHDAGKAHPVWQEAAKCLGDNPPADLVAKTRTQKGRIRYERRGFRHELASALLALSHGQPDLVCYLIASHHGKVRGSFRALPIETPPRDETGATDVRRRFARGVWDGDALPEVDLGQGLRIPPSRLSLSYMELGEDPVTGPSWSARVLGLRDSSALGPFRLAYLEALVKSADERVSERIAAEGVRR